MPKYSLFLNWGTFSHLFVSIPLFRFCGLWSKPTSSFLLFLEWQKSLLEKNKLKKTTTALKKKGLIYPLTSRYTLQIEYNHLCQKLGITAPSLASYLTKIFLAFFFFKLAFNSEHAELFFSLIQTITLSIHYRNVQVFLQVLLPQLFLVYLFTKKMLESCQYNLSSILLPGNTTEALGWYKKTFYFVFLVLVA